MAAVAAALIRPDRRAGKTSAATGSSGVWRGRCEALSSATFAFAPRALVASLR